jgi:protein-tyrosine-phosphatase/predicted ATP-grasp superfamily ATP-dependent carboligase
MSTRKVLVLGDDTRSFLATVRSLGRAGLEVHAAPFNFRAPALTSRFISKVHWLPYSLGDGLEWLEAVEALLRRETFDLVIPCDERTLLPLNSYRAQLGAYTRFAIPDARAMEVFYDKNATREAARALGVSVALGRAVSASDRAQDLIKEVGLPLALKPHASYTLDKLYARNHVEIVGDERALIRTLAEFAGTPHYVEAFFAGRGVGVSVLASNGRILQAFEHHRVHELEGSSYYRVSHELTPALLDAVTKMIDHVAYTGIAMFEFRVNNESGRWILLEVNARPWGSLPLPMAVGADFPYRLYQLLVEGRETPPVAYRTGIYGRNLMPDMHYVRATFGRYRRQPLMLSRFILHSAREYARVLAGREVYDVLVADDPKPGWREIADHLHGATDDLRSKLLSENRVAVRDQHVLRKALQNAGTSGFNVAFVCQGNICRSPLAEALLRREIDDVKIAVRSYGTLPRVGARSPTNAIAAAKAHCVDLEQHRSQHFSQEAAQQASVIVVFDEINRQRVRERYPALDAPVVMLGSFDVARNQDLAISDPDGGDRSKFDAVYGRIASAVAGLARQIATQHITFAIEPLPALDRLERLWRHFDSVGAHSFFLTWSWIGTWLKSIPATTDVALLRARRGAETVGVSVVSLKQSTVRGIFPITQAWLNCAGDPALDCLTIEHNGFASESPWEKQLMPALHDWFASGGFSVDEFVLRGIAPSSGCEGDDRLLCQERREPAYRVPLAEAASIDGLISQLSRNGRQQLRRSIRACEDYGSLSIERAGDEASAMDFFGHMKELHIRSWTHRGQRHAFTNSFFEIFHRALIPTGVGDGTVDLLCVRAGSRVLGYLYNFRRNGVVFSYQSGFDDSVPTLRPGYVSHAVAISYYAAAGMAYYDFLAETNRLKQSFGTERYELCWRRLRKPTLSFRMEAAARRAVNSFKRQAG